MSAQHTPGLHGMKAILSADEAREIFVCDESTGLLYWREDRFKGPRAGAKAGGKSTSGYLTITLRERQYQAHRVVWLMKYGRWPSGQIDHINGVKDDNRIENLRDVDASTNAENQRKANPRNKTGLLGVVAARGKFKAILHSRGRCFYLGAFKTPEEAHNVYLDAKRQIHKGCTL